MTQITAAMVKELRDRTGAGMMDCKKALKENGADLEASIEAMRKSGAAKADKKAGRVAAEGQIIITASEDAKKAAIVEINCETDFVAKDENFIGFITNVAEAVLDSGVVEPEGISSLVLDDGKTVDEVRAELISKIGENIQVRRAQIIESAEGIVASYSHGMRIGVVVSLNGGDAGLGRDVAMHIAASRPVCVSEEQVPTELLEKEKDIFSAQAAESGKPPEIIEKMVTGRMKKYLAEVTLVGQSFVKDPDQTVGKLLGSAGASVNEFVRLEVGEGIEKKQEDFAAEVMAQVRGG